MLLHACFAIFFLVARVAATDKCPPPVTCEERCQQTCANPNPKNCDPNPQCSCPDDGYVFCSKNGKCIPIKECPTDLGCNGDKNAVIIEHPYPCPSTCDSPGPKPCNKEGLIVGCTCKSGYIESKPGGKCILANKCPCGNPCGVNATFVDCAVDCLSDYCPVKNPPDVGICDFPCPCPSGCACKYGYRKKSNKCKRCILAQECPPIECKCNEKWDPCPPPCFSESCADINKTPTVCETLIKPICYPQCVCKPCYKRNANNECIPEDQCSENCSS